MAEGTKKLYRSNDDCWVAGVCGGLAAYFNLDPILVRALFIIFSFVVGGGLFIYLLLWLIIPKEPESDSGDVGETFEAPEIPEENDEE